MAQFLALTDASRACGPQELLRRAVVIGCALALIAAGPFLPAASPLF